MPGAPQGVALMLESNPYVAAKGEWNRIHLGLLRDRRWWQAVAGVELLIVLILAAGFVWLAGQHRTVPYVVEVDALGAARAVRLAENGRAPTDERILRYQLAAFLRGARLVMADRVAMKRGLEQVYAHVRGPARTFLDEYYRTNNPFEIVKTYTVMPTVTSLLPLSDRSWQVRWTEEQRALDGSLLGKSQWEAVLGVAILPPSTQEAIEMNPFGLYVTEIRWTKQL
jgi:type IV secretion system protein VirB5